MNKTDYQLIANILINCYLNIPLLDNKTFNHIKNTFSKQLKEKDPNFDIEWFNQYIDPKLLPF